MGRGQVRQRPLQPAPEPRPLCCRQASLPLVPRKDCGHRLAEGQGPRLTLRPAVAPLLQDKPSVVSLQNLIVRDIANQEKGMFLISGAPPEMYEVHTASRDDRSTWIRVIQQSVRT